MRTDTYKEIFISLSLTKNFEEIQIYKIFGITIKISNIVDYVNDVRNF